MRIAPISTFHNVNRQNNNLAKPNFQSQPAFGSFYNDLDDDTSTGGYSILDLFNWLRGGKPKYTKDEEKEFMKTWDPELGDISDIVDPDRASVDDIMADFESGKLDEDIRIAQEERARELEKENEPPSIFNYTED